MPSIDWNTKTWENRKTWIDRGEEWSVSWGGSYAQWYGTIMPRISKFLPCNAILEIAPGFGRWTKFLLQFCEKYTGVDLSKTCIDDLKKTFSKGEFIHNDGKSLESIDNDAYDFIYSFDSLVHVEMDVIEQYLLQIPQKLTKDGVAFLHMSNRGALQKDNKRYRHSRAESVSAELVRSFCEMNNINLIMQELINWGGDELLDQFVVIKKSESKKREVVVIENADFMLEAGIAKNIYAKYSELL